MADRRVLTAIAILAMVTAVACKVGIAERQSQLDIEASVSSGGPGIWPQFRANSSGTGQVGVQGPTTPQLRWISPPFLTAGANTGIAPVLLKDGTLICVSTYAVYAVHPDGSLRWTYRFPGLDFGGRNSPAVGAGGQILVPTERHSSCMTLPWDQLRNRPGLYALSPRGRLLWKYAEAEPVTSPVVDRHGQIYFATDANQVVALDAQGRVVRRWSVTSDSFGSLALWQGPQSIKGYYAAGRKLYALAPDGGVREQTVGGGDDGAIGLAINPKHRAVYAVTHTGVVCQVDAEELTPRWRLRLPGPVASHPAVTDRAVYVGGADQYGTDGVECHHHSLYAISHGGKIIWNRTLDGELRTAPAVDQRGDIYLTLEAERERATYLLCVSAKGTERWRIRLPTAYGIVSSPVIGDNRTVYCYHDRAYAVSGGAGSEQRLARRRALRAGDR